jgi:serine protease Do
MNSAIRSRSAGRWMTAGGVLAIGVVLVGVALAQYARQPQAGAAHTQAEQPASSASVAAKSDTGASFAKSLSAAFHRAAAQVLPAVVTITTTPVVAERSKDGGPEDDDDQIQGGLPDIFRSNPDFRQFFGRGFSRVQPREAEEMGSGVIIDPAGVILTNNHVVQDGKVKVRLADGREFPAKEVKTDPRSDLAVVRIEGAGTLQAARMGDSESLEVGDWVLALGQPFGLEGTVTAGIISAKGRGLGLATRESFLQTDAAINPGNSGGPLVNLDGEIIGINTAISTQSGGYQGVGFAIPVNLAKWVSQQLIATGKVRRSFLGIVIQPVTQQLAEHFGVKVHSGAVVSEVPDGTPAAKAGLKPRDIVVEFAGKKVTGPQDLQAAVEESPAGSSQTMTIIRDGKRLVLPVSPGEQPADYGMARPHGPGAVRPESANFDKLGIRGETLTAEMAKHLGVKVQQGVAITEVRAGGLAERAGLAVGMVITEANRKSTKTVEDLRAILDSEPLSKGILLLVQSSDGARFVVIRAQD